MKKNKLISGKHNFVACSPQQVAENQCFRVKGTVQAVSSCCQRQRGRTVCNRGLTRRSEEVTDLRFRHSSQFLSVLLGGKAFFSHGWRKSFIFSFTISGLRFLKHRKRVLTSFEYNMECRILNVELGQLHCHSLSLTFVRQQMNNWWIQINLNSSEEEKMPRTSHIWNRRYVKIKLESSIFLLQSPPYQFHSFLQQRLSVTLVTLHLFSLLLCSADN